MESRGTGEGRDGAALTRPAATIRRYLRGSSLLLAGRLAAMVANFLVQVLTVRYLSRSDYGAFAYALAVTSTGAGIAILGLTRGVTRFVPIDHERGEYASMFGTMIAAIASVLGLGLAIVAVVVGFRGLWAPATGVDAATAALLVVLIGLAPLQALDNVLQALVAIFGSPRELFWRRYVIGPGLKLGAIGAVVLARGSVWMLAWCHLVAGALGVALYAVMLYRVLRDAGLLSSPRRRPVLKLRRLFGFSVPLLSTDLYLSLKVTIAVVILEALHGTPSVAQLRAVVPVAGLCALAMESFKLLFSPLAARLYARQDDAALNDLYWRSTAWIAVATFPVFCICFFLAEPVTVVLFSARYADAGPVLAILAVGAYVNAALGLNLHVLQVYGRVRAIVVINVAAMGVALLLCALLVRPLGARGAALAITFTLIVHNLAVQAALHWLTGIDLFQARYLRVYLSIAAAVAVLLGASLLGAPLPVMAAAVISVSLLLVLVNRGALEMADTFPELARVPLLRLMVGPKPESA